MILDYDLVKAIKIYTQSGALSFSFKQSRILQEIMQEMWCACCIFRYQCTLPLLCFQSLCLSLLIVILEGWYQSRNQCHSHNICERVMSTWFGLIECLQKLLITHWVWIEFFTGCKGLFSWWAVLDSQWSLWLLLSTERQDVVSKWWSTTCLQKDCSKGNHLPFWVYSCWLH